MKKRCKFCFEEYGNEFSICPKCGREESEKLPDGLNLTVKTVLQKRYELGVSLYQDDFEIKYLAWDTVLCTKVIVKEYFPSEFCTRMLHKKDVTIFGDQREEQFRAGYEEFLREAKVLAGFQNMQGLVRILDSFEENKTVYVVQEYIEGKTLAEILSEGKTYTPEKALALMRPVMQTLSQIHRQGIIHKDIIPDNILIDPENRARIMNFGASRFATTSHSRSLSILINRGYSPEELYRSRKDKGPYTDVYGIAAVLYRMTTGKVPPDSMERRTMLEKCRKDLLQSPEQCISGVEKQFENAVLNAMGVKIEDRTPDMEQFLEELDAKEPVKLRKTSIRKKDFMKWPLWAKLAGVCGCAAVTLFSVLFATGIIGNFVSLHRSIELGKNMTRVPSVVNVSLEKADKRIEEAELLYGISGKEFSSSIQSNMILFQDIDGGRIVDKKSILGITISGGMEMEAIPSVTGLKKEEAVSILETRDFTVTLKQEYSKSIAAGYITKQEPDGSKEAERGSEVILTISKGRKPESTYVQKKTEVPQFVGASFEEAQRLAEEADLMLVVSKKVYSSDCPENEVMTQNISKGRKVKAGSSITITVSLGEEKVLVPDVTYVGIEEAKKQLKERGLSVVVSNCYSDTVMKDVIVSQSPEAYSSVKKGDAVSLVVSIGSQPVTVPDVMKMTEEEAIACLQGSQLVVEVSYCYSESGNNGIVLRQSIEAGRQTERGTKVILTVGLGEEMVEIERVIGMNQETARTKLTQKGLRVEIVQAYDTAAAGTVIGQSFTPGTSQKKGAGIILTVSKGVQPAVVPYVIDETEYLAVERLKEAGILAEIKYENNKAAAGFVISQSPKAQTQVPKGSIVSITVSLGEKTEEPVSKKQTGISIAVMPNKTEYIVGETIQTDGMVINVRYSDGTAEQISEGFSVSGNLLRKGRTAITVYYRGDEAVYYVTVKEEEPPIITPPEPETKPDLTQPQETEGKPTVPVETEEETMEPETEPEETKVPETRPEETREPETESEETREPETEPEETREPETEPEMTEAPVIATEAPVITTEAPVITTEAPVITTEAPVITTETPVTTTEAPVTTTEAPVTTTEVPVITTVEVEEKKEQNTWEISGEGEQ